LEEQVFDADFVDALCATFVNETGMSDELDMPAEECIAIIKRLLIDGRAMIKIKSSPDGDRFGPDTARHRAAAAVAVSARMADAIGDPVLVSMRQRRAELVKKRDRLNDRIEYWDRLIAEQPEKIARYEELRRRHEAGEDTLFPLMSDPWKLYGRK